MLTSHRHAVRRTLATLPFASLAVGMALAGPAHAGFSDTIVGDTLTIQGDAANDRVELRLDQATGDELEIDYGIDGTIDQSIRRNRFDRIHILGRGGDDEVRINSVNGGFTHEEQTLVNLEDGNDVFVGGIGPERVSGGSGDDRLTGGDGPDVLSGNSGADTIEGGRGDDSIFGGDGTDQIRWSAGDGSDAIAGGAGDDVLVGTGKDTRESYGASPGPAAGQTTLTIDGVPQQISGIAQLVLLLKDGQDTLSVAPDVDPSLDMQVDGGAGNDTLFAGPGNDTLTGGPGQDAVHGNDGDDRFVWNVGDGDDTFYGRDGSDTLRVHGTDDPEHFSLVPSGGLFNAVRVERNGVRTSSAVDIEKFRVDARGGNDIVVGETLARSQPLHVEAGAGDDRVTGGNGNDTISGGPGTDRLAGGPGADVFHCGNVEDILLDVTAEDTVAADCGVREQPTPGQPQPEQPQPEQPQPEQPQQPAPPADGTAPADPQAPADGVQAGFRGFARPTVRATKSGLRVTIRNTHSEAITVRVAARERVPARRGRVYRYRTVKRTIPAGARVAVNLRGPSKLRKRIARQLRTSRRVVRKPVVTAANTATGGKQTVTARLVARAR